MGKTQLKHLFAKGENESDQAKNQKDKLTIRQYQELLSEKIKNDPKLAKKAAQIIEDMLGTLNGHKK